MKKIIYIILVFVISSCNTGNNQNKLTDKQIKIINTVINNFFERNNIVKSDYLINPYYGSFSFDRVSLKKGTNKEDILKKFKWDEEYFSTTQKEINIKFKGKLSKELSKLSLKEKSKYIFSFSGFSKNLVFFKVYNLCDEINKEDIIKKNIDFSKKYKKEISLYVVTFNNNEIIDILIDNSTIYELECNENR